jgi:hypothetical protein
VTEFLHPEFLNDPREYRAAAELWLQRWQELVRATGERWCWESPWLNTTFADGTSQADGNPIFSAVCPSRRLGIRVIQLPPSNVPEFDFWTDVFAQGQPGETRELVISCVLSADTLAHAIDLMNQWVTEEAVEILR